MKTHIKSTRFENPKRDLLEIFLDGKNAGRALYNYQPKYRLYKSLGIPEIQDIFIEPNFRRNGLATFIIKHCEETAKKQGFSQIGISVGVHKKYGAAQVLYAKLGYIPDGLGVTYDRAGVDFASIKPIDDDLCLMLIKDI